jgi:hypothetical protein
VKPGSNRFTFLAPSVLRYARLVIFLPCLLGLAHPGAYQQATASSQNPLEPLQRCIVGAGVFPPLFREIIMTKLYVGNLPFTATEDAVRNLFSPHGTVEKLSLINDRDTGRPRGFGFLEMSSADASRAMQALNGKDFDGRALKINEAQDKPSSAGGNARY